MVLGRIHFLETYCSREFLEPDFYGWVLDILLAEKSVAISFCWDNRWQIRHLIRFVKYSHDPWWNILDANSLYFWRIRNKMVKNILDCLHAKLYLLVRFHYVFHEYYSYCEHTGKRYINARNSFLWVENRYGNVETIHFAQRCWSNILLGKWRLVLG